MITGLRNYIRGFGTQPVWVGCGLVLKHCIPSIHFYFDIY